MSSFLVCNRVTGFGYFENANDIDPVDSIFKQQYGVAAGQRTIRHSYRPSVTQAEDDCSDQC